MKVMPLFCLLSFAVPVVAAESSKNAEAFQATSHYTKQMLGESQAMGGKVLEKIDVANYTYVQFVQGKGQVWLATNRVDVQKGDIVSFENAQPMHNFHSKTLNRTFDEIYFVTDLQVKR